MSTGEANQPRVLVIIPAAGGIKTPPIDATVRRQIGYHLRLIQGGGLPSPPISRPLPEMGPNVHYLRLSGPSGEWRVYYQIRAREVIVGEVFHKKTQAIPGHLIRTVRKRFEDYP